MKRREFIGLFGIGTASLWLPGCAGDPAPRQGSEQPIAPPPAPSPAPSEPTTVAPYTSGDRSAAFLPDGRQALVNTSRNSVEILEANGSVSATLGGIPSTATGGLNGPQRALWDAKNSRLLVLEIGNRRVQGFDAQGKATGFVVTLENPVDMVLGADGLLYVAELQQVTVIDSAGAMVRKFGELNGARGLDVAADGNLHVVAYGNAGVFVFSPAGALLRTYGKNELVGPRDIAFDATGRAWVSDLIGAAVVIFDASGTKVDRFQPKSANGKPAAPSALALKADGQMFIETRRAAGG